MKRRLLAVSWLSLWLAYQSAAFATLDQSLDATCRLRTADGTTGSGCVFAVAEGKVWVLTAAHVVDGTGQVACEFWHEGHMSRPLAGVVAGRHAGYDVATVVVPVQAFQGVLPKTVPMAPPDFVVRPGETITSAGCARGAWATGLKGHALGYSGLDLRFSDGRSGSAIFDRDGRCIVGIVSARTTSGEIHGIASSIQAVYAAFGRPAQRNTALAALKVQPAGRLVPVRGMTDDQFAMTNRPERRDSFGHWSLGFDDSALLSVCPGGVCPDSSSHPRWYLLPYRYREQFRNQQPSPQVPQGGGAWPTLPPANSSPPASSPPEITGLAEAQKGLSDAVAKYLEAESRARAEQEAEKKIGAVSAEVGAAAQQALKGDFSEAADTVGESGTIWATLAEILWSVLAPLFGVGAVGFAFGKVIVRAVARSPPTCGKTTTTARMRRGPSSAWPKQRPRRRSKSSTAVRPPLPAEVPMANQQRGCGLLAAILAVLAALIAWLGRILYKM